MSVNKTDNRYTINENERKKILDDIKVGIWRIEYEPERLPQLYGDANMYAILGAEPDMQPEELYQHWHERIEPVYLSYVDKAVERLITTGHPVEVEYIWRHPQYGKTVVRCDATLSSQAGSRKIVMLGMHRDITHKIDSNMIQDDEYCVFDYYKMTHCGKHLIRAYEDISLVDIETKKIYLIACREKHCQALEDGKSLLELIGECIPLEDREEVYKLFSDASIREIVAKNSSMSVDFRRGVRCGRHRWVRGTLYTVQINGIAELLFAVQDIQNEYTLKRLKEEKEDMLYSFIHDRSVIYECDTETQQLQILKHDVKNIKESVASSRLSLPELAEKLCTHYADGSEWSEIKTFLSYGNIRNCVEKKSKKFISFPICGAYLRHDYIKISVLPSSKSKTKAYIAMELMDQKERLYPILESYIRDMNDHFYYIDLKTDYFFQFIGSTQEDKGASREGYNYTEETIKDIERFVLEEDRELARKQMSPEFILKELENKEEFSFVVGVMTKHGEIRKKLLTYKTFDISKGCVLMQKTDVTDMYNKDLLLKKAQRESMMDTLTQLYNRLGSERMIKKALTETDENKNSVLIMLDLDNFKEVNDKFGHPMGDQILCEAAQKLKECFRSGDIIGRLGGDEYIIYLPNMLNKADIYPVLKRVVEKLSILCKNETESVIVTASVGAAFFRGQSYERLYKEADIALYHSKKEKNKYSLFEDVSEADHA